MGKTEPGELLDNQSLGPCPVCGREMLAGRSVDQHHWLPKSKGGREADLLHLICHRKIHSLFSRQELAAQFSTSEAVRPSDAEIHPLGAPSTAEIRGSPPAAERQRLTGARAALFMQSPHHEYQGEKNQERDERVFLHGCAQPFHQAAERFEQFFGPASGLGLRDDHAGFDFQHAFGLLKKHTANLCQVCVPKQG
jgi:hypothetical protein